MRNGRIWAAQAPFSVARMRYTEYRAVYATPRVVQLYSKVHELRKPATVRMTRVKPANKMQSNGETPGYSKQSLDRN